MEKNRRRQRKENVARLHYERMRLIRWLFFSFPSRSDHFSVLTWDNVPSFTGIDRVPFAFLVGVVMLVFHRSLMK